jgi:exopolysaccharide biosynthesis protein
MGLGQLNIHPPAAQAQQKVTANQGVEIVINGSKVALPWRTNGQKLELSDTGLLYQFGLELLNTSNYRQQPVDGYANAKMILSASLDKQYRYLDITKLAAANKWNWKIAGKQLQINTPKLTVADVRATNLGSDRGQITIKLDGTVPWRLSQDATEGFLTIYTAAKPQLTAETSADPESTSPETGVIPSPVVQASVSSNVPAVPTALAREPGDEQRITNTAFKVTSTGQKTIIQFPIKLGTRARARNIAGRQIAIDITPTAMTERKIAWAPGLGWQQKWQIMGKDRFPVSLLELDPKQVQLRPILPQSDTVVGSKPIGVIATNQQAAAAINGGYFNRNTRQPLGAIKINGKLLSSPILGRSALGWQKKDGWEIARFTYAETISNSQGLQVSNTYLNSGYAQNGVARYTTAWGKAYQPITNNELILTVQNDKITQITPRGLAKSVIIPIPVNGYLLVGRGVGTLEDWQPGSGVSIDSVSKPATFDKYAHILGAGPWLIQNSKIIVDAQAEKFSGSFGTQSAARSAIAFNAQGKIWIVAIHDRAGGKGPTLTELAQLLKQMGAIDALNLDGGSSTSMIVGGQLVNRSPATAARVHNGLGIFLER